MHALVKQQPAPGLDLLEVPDPAPGHGEVLLRVEAASVCGSDIGRYMWTANYEAGASKAMERLPRIMGHELAGVVVEFGSGVRTLSVGDRVAVRNVLGCGRCSECDRGMENLCRDRRTIGVDRDGGYATLAVIPERNCFVMPPSMSFDLGAGVTPFAVATHAVEHADLEPGERIVIWGAGPIGLGVLLAARLRGVEDAVVLDIKPDRLRLAKQAGAETLDVRDVAAGDALLGRFGRRTVDAVFEAAGADGAVPASLPVLRKRGSMVLLGNFGSPATFDLMALIMDQQRLIGTRSSSRSAWNLALATVERSGFGDLLGDAVGLDGALAKFADAAAGRCGPFTIRPNEGAGSEA